MNDSDDRDRYPNEPHEPHERHERHERIEPESSGGVAGPGNVHDTAAAPGAAPSPAAVGQPSGRHTAGGAGTVGGTPPTASAPGAERPRALRRSREDRIISGLAGGLGAFFGVDPTLFRVAFVVLMFAGGGGLILYLVMTLVVPSEGDDDYGASETMRRGAEDLADSFRGMTGSVREGDGERSRNVAAILLILLGAFFLVRNADWLNWFDAGWIWPVLLIGLGIWLIARRR